MSRVRFFDWFAYNPRTVGKDTAGMSDGQFAAYHRLMSILWDEGPLPEAQLSGRAFGHWDAIKHCFAPSGEAISLPWLEEYRTRAMEKSATQTKNRSNRGDTVVQPSFTVVSPPSTIVSPSREEERVIVEGKKEEENTGTNVPTSPPAPKDEAAENTSSTRPRRRTPPDPRTWQIVANFKERVGLAYDGGKHDGYAARHFLTAFEKLDPGGDHVLTVAHLTNAALNDPFWGSRMTNLEKLYRHRGEFINKIQKPSTNGYLSSEDKLAAAQRILAERQSAAVADTAGPIDRGRELP